MDVDLSDAKLLVVEDRPAVFETLEEILRERGYAAQLVSGYDDTLLKAKEDSPDLILINPEVEGGNGFRIADALKADPSTASIPVIFLSSMRDRSSRKQAYECGAVDYIMKPFETLGIADPRGAADAAVSSR